jgi:hypothetical protein
LAQNRQEARDRVGLEQDRERAEQSRADMDFLAREMASLRISVGDLATRDFIGPSCGPSSGPSGRARGRRGLITPA